MPESTYDACIRKMYRLGRFGIILGLTTIQDILSSLGNPQDSFKSIHIAGTNGKGSTASALATILRLAGYKVGLYTSPHLVRFNERIQINGRPIADERVVTAYEAVKSAHKGTREPTFFELTTAMAFHEFAREKVEWAIVETGMGGRLDATNIVTPRLSVITNISLEHQAYLGKTIPKITEEKAGIIKEGIPVVTGVWQPSAVKVLQAHAKEKNAPLYHLGEDFSVRRHPGGEAFTYHGITSVWKNLATGLAGRYQVDNAALVLAACELLSSSGEAHLPKEIVAEGLRANIWPGRLEFLSQTPTVILDGAHNLSAARELARFISERFSGKEVTLVSGILDDKAYPEMLRCLLPHCSRAILTRPAIDRATSPEALYDVAAKIISDLTVIPDAAAALNHALATSSPDHVIIVAGSLYLVGEIKEAIEKGKVKHPSFRA